MPRKTCARRKAKQRQAKNYERAYYNEVAENVQLRAKLRNVLEALGVDEFVAKQIADHEKAYHED